MPTWVSLFLMLFIKFNCFKIYYTKGLTLKVGLGIIEHSANENHYQCLYYHLFPKRFNY
jgi:hypothetical protein